MKKKSLKLMIIQIIVIIITIILNVFDNGLNTTLNMAHFILIIQFILSIVVSLKLMKNIINIYMMMIGTLFLFNFGRIITSILGYGDYGLLSGFAVEVIPFEIRCKIVILMIFAIQGMTIAVISCKKNKISNLKNMKFNESYYIIGKVTFYIVLSFVIIKNLQMIIFTFSSGYMAYYTEGINLHWILNISDDIFKFSFYLILVSNPNWDKLKKIFAIYTLIQIISIFTGFRGIPMVEILLLILYLSYKKNNLVKIAKIIPVFLVLIIVLIVTGDIRIGERVNLDKENIVIDFINGQGTSLNVVSLTIEDKYGYLKQNRDYILYPIKNVLGIIKKDSNKFWEPINNNSLAHNVSYYTNSVIYMNGGGMGGSSIAEMYLLGGSMAVFLINMIIMFLLISLDRKIFVKRYYMYIWLVIVPSILYSPRDYALGFIFQLPKAIIFIIIVEFIKKFILQNKKLKIKKLNIRIGV